MARKIAVEMYLLHNEGKSAVVEKFIRTFKNKTCKCVTWVSRNVYIDKLDDIVNKCNNTYHTSIKMKPADVKSNTYISSSQEINDRDPKFKTGDTVRISKCKNILQKAMFQIGLKKFFWLKKLKALCRGHIFLVILKVKKLKK